MNDLTEIEKLRHESSFVKYCRLLQTMAQRYTVLIASCDTPCGSKNFNLETAVELMRVGLTIPLHNKYRCSYAAIIDEGKLIFEGISQTNKISFYCSLNGINVGVESLCYTSNDGVKACKIIINGKDHAINRRGLSFVIFNKQTDSILDSVNFDTYPDEITCLREEDSPVIADFKSRNPGVTFISSVYPRFPSHDLSSNEKFIVNNKITHTKIELNAASLKTAINQYIDTPDGVREVLSTPAAYIGTDGARHMFDCSGKYVNVVNGHRLTTDQPLDASRTIYIVGGCTMFGLGTRDKGTLASWLQKILNKQAPEQKFVVENYGYFLEGTNIDNETTAILNSLPLKPGDIVIGYGHGICTGSEEFFDRPHNFGELFFDDVHVTETCQKLVAEQVFATLKSHDFFIDKKVVCQTSIPQNSINKHNTDYGFSKEQMNKLELYKADLTTFYNQMFGEADVPPRIGSIVMNCNPFTLGHRYLIEQAASKVDFLIVFVVHEDKSFFPLSDRLTLVDRGTADLPNVGVIDSGEFIISTLTFREYFNKSELQDRKIDTSLDVTLFAQEIAPAIHISIRFAGSEPLDKVTAQYNNTLRSLLPRYGIDFEEIPRLEIDNEPVSASHVRKLLQTHNFDAIERLVPETTFTYLKEKFASHQDSATK